MKKYIYILVSLIFFVVNCEKESSELHITTVENNIFGQKNAIWTESIYFRGYRPSTRELLTESHLINYGETLQQYNIKYAYLFAGPYDKAGHVPDYAFSDIAKQSVQFLKENYPDIIILPWLGGVQNKTVNLGDSLWVKNAVRDTKKLVDELGVSGVHIDFEYIIPGDPYLDQGIGEEQPGDRESYGNNVNEFHRKLRQLLPNEFISSVVVTTSPDARPWKRKTSMEELTVLTQYIDQLSFLYYDTSIRDQDIFEKNSDYLIKDILTLKEVNSNVQYLVAIGTFINEPQLHKYRDLNIESIPNSLTTIKNSVVKIDSAATIVDGIAIYSGLKKSDSKTNNS